MHNLEVAGAIPAPATRTEKARFRRAFSVVEMQGGGSELLRFHRELQAGISRDLSAQAGASMRRGRWFAKRNQ